MEEKLFSNWNFIYENSDDISMHVEYFREGHDEPSLIEDIFPNDFKKIVGSDKAFHVEIDGSFELVIHAIKDNIVYCTFLMRTSEYGWRESGRFALSKEEPHKTDKINYFNKPHGFYVVFIKEWWKA